MPTNSVEMPASMEEAMREVSHFKSMVTEAVEDGVKSAVRAIKHGRDAAEDVISEARHTVKHRPFQAIAVVFGAGVLIGAVLAWMGSRRD